MPEVYGWTSGPCPFCKKLVDITHTKNTAKDGTVYGKGVCPNCGETVSYSLASKTV